MNGVQVIQAALRSTQWVLSNYLNDLSDADLLVRPTPGANHIAWQLGHLINSEVMLVKDQWPSAVYAELPAGWVDLHGPQAAGRDGPDGYPSRAEYVRIFNDVRKATLDVAGSLTDADLDKPTHGRFAQFAPTHGDYLILVANHTLMHGGQFSVVRRKLGKPVLF